MFPPPPLLLLRRALSHAFPTMSPRPSASLPVSVLLFLSEPLFRLSPAADTIDANLLRRPAVDHRRPTAQRRFAAAHVARVAAPARWKPANSAAGELQHGAHCRSCRCAAAVSGQIHFHSAGSCPVRSLRLAARRAHVRPPRGHRQHNARSRSRSTFSESGVDPRSSKKHHVYVSATGGSTVGRSVNVPSRSTAHAY